MVNDNTQAVSYTLPLYIVYDCPHYDDHYVINIYIQRFELDLCQNFQGSRWYLNSKKQIFGLVGSVYQNFNDVDELSL